MAHPSTAEKVNMEQRARARVAAVLPRGGTLTNDDWYARHRWMLRVLWAHVIVLGIWGVLARFPVTTILFEVLPIATCGAIAGTSAIGRRIRSALVAVALLTASAVVVHLMDGVTEGHFHFFVMVALLALYEEWSIYLLAIGYVLVHHVVFGMWLPATVFAHHSGGSSALRLAAIHAAFIAGLAVVNVVNWRMNEDTRQRAVTGDEELAELQTLRVQQERELVSADDLRGAVAEFSERVAAGDLTARLQVGEDPRHAAIAENLEHMVAGLSGMSGRVRQSSGEVAAASSQILAAISQHTAATSEQAASIAQTNATVEQVRATAQQATERAHDVERQAQSAVAVSEDGQEAVEEIVVGMNAIRATVERIAQDILALSERTQAIGNITQFVNDLADQSNMLALNATIEAAKAGEQGRGFAVVADEVRKLAEQSKQATSQVQEILAEIHRSTDAAVRAAEDGTRVVEDGMTRSERAGEAFRRMADTVRETAAAASMIGSSARRQQIGIDQVAQAISDVSLTTNQMAQGATQIEGAAGSLSTLAEGLEDLTSRYQLDLEPSLT